MKYLNVGTIKLENIELRILESKDVNSVYVSWLNNKQIVKFTEQKGMVHSLESVKQYVNEKFLSENEYLFGIYKKSKHIGNIKLGPVDFVHKTAEISFFIGQVDEWGKGIMTKVINKLVTHAFENLGIEKISAGCYDENLGSKKVLIKCGFKIEGIKVKQVILNNERIDVIIFGIISEQTKK